MAFALAAVYWGAGLGTSPAWSTWVGTLVPAAIARQLLFAPHAVSIRSPRSPGFVIGGFSLQWGVSAGHALLAFRAVVFAGAAVPRAPRRALLACQSEPQPLPDGHRQVSLREFFRRFRGAGDGRLLVYLLSVQAAAQIAGPVLHAVHAPLDRLVLRHVRRR